jgi:hypothetical protein
LRWLSASGDGGQKANQETREATYVAYYAFGFYSVVAKSGDPHDGLLTIRSRVRSDLEALKEFVPSLGPIAESDETYQPK